MVRITIDRCILPGRRLPSCSWATDADFPVLFGSDAEGSAAEAFGVGRRDNGMAQSRAVVVVDPEGRVGWSGKSSKKLRRARPDSAGPSLL